MTDDLIPRAEHDRMVREAVEAERERASAMNRVTFYGDQLGEIVTDAGCHLEHMGGKSWFLACDRSDGTSVAVWINGKVTMVEERPAAAIRAGEKP